MEDVVREAIMELLLRKQQSNEWTEKAFNADLKEEMELIDKLMDIFN